MATISEKEKEMYVAEVERRFRERTPANDIEAALPEYRVGRSEMRAWFFIQFGRFMELNDELDVQPQVRRLYKKLRKEFPHERWS